MPPSRLLVRSLIPEALRAKSMADVETARVNYARLDEAGSPVRLRLSSTVVRARNVGDPATATEVDVTYVRDGKAARVRVKGCVLAFEKLGASVITCPGLKYPGYPGVAVPRAISVGNFRRRASPTTRS